MRTLLARSALAALALLAAVPAYAEISWTQINQELGREGADQPGGLKRFSFPRSDIKVSVDGVELKTGLALGGWLAFQPTQGNDALVVGDLVLKQEEVGAVVKKLLDGGIIVTAIHNHLLRAEPFPMYVHVEASGNAGTLAKSFKEAIALTAIPAPAPAAAGQEPGFNPETIANIMGRKGTLDGVVYKYNIARIEPIHAGSMGPQLGAAHGTGIAINFQSAGTGKVATTGDFVLTEREVAPVMKALRDNNIEVTALHSHMLDEEPRLAFMHFWAVGAPDAVAKGLRAALDKVAVQQAAAN